MATPQNTQQEKKKKSRKRRTTESAFSKFLEPETRETLSKDDRLRDEIETALKELSLKGDEILEIQTRLIEEDVEEEEFIELISELSAGHYSEVVDERSAKDKCALPTCKNRINPERPLKITTAQELVVGSKNHKSFRKYCSFECLRKSIEIIQNTERNTKNIINVQSFLQSVQEKIKQDKALGVQNKQKDSPDQQKLRLVSPKSETQSLSSKETLKSTIVENKPAPPSTKFSSESHSTIENHQPKTVSLKAPSTSSSAERKPRRVNQSDTTGRDDPNQVKENIASVDPIHPNPRVLATNKVSIPAIIVRPLPKPRKTDNSEDLFRLNLGTGLFVSALIRKWRTEQTIAFWTKMTGGSSMEPIQLQGMNANAEAKRTDDESLPVRFPIVDSISTSRKRKEVFFDFIDPLFPKLVLAMEIENHSLLRSNIIELVNTFDMDFGLPAMKNHHHLTFLLTFVYSIGRYIPSVWKSIQDGLADWIELVQACGLAMDEFEQLVKDSSL